MAHHAHRAAGPSAVRTAVVTVSDTRTLADDTSGALAAELLAAAGHPITTREIVRDEPSEITAAVTRLSDDAQTQAIVLTGGTGIAPRDRTPETLRALLVTEIEGFGELFRMLSFEQIGAAAMLSRAVAGVGPNQTLIFALPGSSGAVRLGVERLIAPELGHMTGLLGA